MLSIYHSIKINEVHSGNQHPSHRPLLSSLHQAQHSTPLNMVRGGPPSPRVNVLYKTAAALGSWVSWTASVLKVPVFSIPHTLAKPSGRRLGCCVSLCWVHRAPKGEGKSSLAAWLVLEIPAWILKQACIGQSWQLSLTKMERGAFSQYRGL